MLVTWRGMFLVKHALQNPSFCSHSTQKDSYGFFVKLSSKPSCEIYLVLHECVFFRFKSFLRQVIFSSNVPKKEIHFFFVSVGP